MKILVVGGLGFIGSNLVDLLVEKDYEVHVIDNLSAGSLLYKNDRAIYHIIDLIRFESSIIFDVIYHLAAPISHINYANEHVSKTINEHSLNTTFVCELARQCKCKLFCASSVASYIDRHFNPYAFAKNMVEDICQFYIKYLNVEIYITRFFNVYGNRSRMIGDYKSVISTFEDQYKLNIPLTIIGNGKQCRDFINVLDVVDALFLLLTESNHLTNIYDIKSGVDCTINYISSLFNHPVTYIDDRRGEIDIVEYTRNPHTIEINNHSIESYIKNILK